jgi:hypothetical protein
MNPIHLHELARTHQAELLAEAARERLAHAARGGETSQLERTVERMRAIVDLGLGRIGRARRAALPPRSA